MQAAVRSPTQVRSPWPFRTRRSAGPTSTAIATAIRTYTAQTNDHTGDRSYERRRASIPPSRPDANYFASPALFFCSSRCPHANSWLDKVVSEPYVGLFPRTEKGSDSNNAVSEKPGAEEASTFL